MNRLKNMLPVNLSNTTIVPSVLLKKYLSGFDLVANSINSYVTEVKNVSFPTPEQSYE
jgi:ketopantoate hydroxymethyltransferase